MSLASVSHICSGDDEVVSFLGGPVSGLECLISVHKSSLPRPGLWFILPRAGLQAWAHTLDTRVSQHTPICVEVLCVRAMCNLLKTNLARTDIMAFGIASAEALSHAARVCGLGVPLKPLSSRKPAIVAMYCSYDAFRQVER